MTRLLWFGGVAWHETPGGNRRIVGALHGRAEIVWVDPPRRSAWAGVRAEPAPVAEASHVLRVRVPAPPGAWRAGVRSLTRLLTRMVVRRAVSSICFDAVVVSNPVMLFPADVRAPRVLYVTDDWIAGSRLMGFPPGVVETAVDANLAVADVVVAVSPRLLEQTLARTSRAIPGVVLANGAPEVAVVDATRKPVAGVVGQINERLDLAYLSAVAEAGISLRFVGPRFDQDEAFRTAFDELVRRAGVEWVGSVPPAEVPEQLAQLAVGLTPYAVSDFNQASFPLKTLEYLAAGLPVVSTDLDASKWLQTELVSIRSTPAAFCQAVIEAIEAPADPQMERRRRDFAAGHSWVARGEQLLALVDSLGKTEGLLSERTF